MTLYERAGRAPARPATGRAGDGHRRPAVGGKLLVSPTPDRARLARTPRARSRRRTRRAGRARGRSLGRAPLRARGSDDTRGPGRHPGRQRLRRELGATASDVDLRRRRLHRRPRQGRQGARLPRPRVRRPRDLRHPPPVPDGRRGPRHLARADVRRPRRHLGPRTRCASSPTTRSSTSRRSRARSPPRSATSA